MSSALIQTAANLTTMLLIGFWHGASWSFVAWGIFHGALLTIEKFLQFKPRKLWQKLLTAGITFHLVSVGWVLFRATSFSSAFAFFKGLFRFSQMQWLGYFLPSILVTAIVTYLIDWLTHTNSPRIIRLLYEIRPIAITAGIIILIILGLLNLARGEGSYPFIYGQF